MGWAYDQEFWNSIPIVRVPKSDWSTLDEVANEAGVARTEVIRQIQSGNGAAIRVKRGPKAKTSRLFVTKIPTWK